MFDKWFCTVQGLGEVCHSDQVNIDSCCERFVLTYDCQCATIGVFFSMQICGYVALQSNKQRSVSNPDKKTAG